MPPPPDGRAARLALQLLQRLGSFLKFLSAKNSCSPAVQTKGSPQSTQVSVLSWNSITTSLTRPFYPATLAGCRDPACRPAPGPTSSFEGPCPSNSPTRSLDRRSSAHSVRVAASRCVLALPACLTNRTRGAAFCAFVCARAPAWRDADRLVSDRRNAS